MTAPNELISIHPNRAATTNGSNGSVHASNGNGSAHPIPESDAAAKPSRFARFKVANTPIIVTGQAVATS